jgi:hypothetical protein
MVPLALYTPIPFLLLASGGSVNALYDQQLNVTKVFHTCGYLVEIPDTYRNYKEFESEMKNIMSSDVLHFDLS